MSFLLTVHECLQNDGQISNGNYLKLFAIYFFVSRVVFKLLQVEVHANMAKLQVEDPDGLFTTS